MQLAPVNPSVKFVPVTGFADPDPTTPAPATRMLGWKEEPADTEGLVTVRYRGTADGAKSQFSVRNDPTSTGEPWYEVTGAFDDALRAARDLAIVDGYTEDPTNGHFARTSVAVLEAGEGVWHLSRMMYPDGMGDGMDPIISMPVDCIPASFSDVSVPFGDNGKRPFDTPDDVSVRFDDARVKALVGRENFAVAPGH